MIVNKLTAEYKKIFTSMLKKDNFAIFIHRGPDGDAIGSGMAIKAMLLKLGKKAELFCSDEIPSRLSFISDYKTDFDLNFIPETIISIDLATPNLFGDKYIKYADRVDYCIDHHYTNSGYAKESIVISNASSTGEVLYRLFKSANLKIDDYIANKLYCAITSDTGCFKYSNVTSGVHRIAADLVSYNIDTAWINRQIFDVASISRLRIESKIIDQMYLYENGNIVIAFLNQRDLEELGVEENDTDGLVSVPRRIESVNISAFLREMSDGKIRASLRSECNMDVAEVAAVFGGGGHCRAAGCTLECSMDDAIKEMSEVLCSEWRKYIDNNRK